MARGGKRPGAGRKPGAANTKTREIADKAVAEGVTPLEYMLNIMRGACPEGASAEDKIRHMMLAFEAAKAAAPYVHPRLAAVEHSGKDGGPLETITRIELVAPDHDNGEG